MKGGEQGGFFWVAEDLSLGDKADAEGAKKRRVVGCVSLRLTTSSSDDSGQVRIILYTDHIGMLILSITWQTRVMGILSHLSVREDSRRRGIGRGLVQKVASRLWHGDRAIFMFVVVTVGDRSGADCTVLCSGSHHSHRHDRGQVWIFTVETEPHTRFDYWFYCLTFLITLDLTNKSLW